jgi:hypothetical protein
MNIQIVCLFFKCSNFRELWSQKVKESREHAMNRGLGGILRSIPSSPLQAPSDAFIVEKQAGSMVSRVVKPSDEPKQSSGPLASERKGGLWKRCVCV